MTKPSVYIIGSNTEKIAAITEQIDGFTTVRRVHRSSLMNAIFKKKPHCIIIIESDLDPHAMMSVDSTISLEYIPVICVSEAKGPLDMVRYIEHASYMPESHMASALSLMVEQACHFSEQYNALHTCYDTYEIMNEEVRDALDIYLDQRVDYSGLGIVQYLDAVFRSNMFLEKYPKRIWLLQLLETCEYRGVLYDVDNIQLVKDMTYYDDRFDFADYEETGFIKNEGETEFSDINSFGQLIPRAVLEASGSIRNAAVFSNREVMLIGLDYDGRITQTDLNILKALTIKIDMMVNIKSEVTALEESFVYTMNALARAAEGKDDVTGHHIRRVNLYAGLIAKALGMDRDFIQQIEVAAQMHDVGKILIADDILNKPAKLTEDEYEVMKNHTVFGQKVIGDSDHLAMASSIARYHHEKYDGTGYPDGLVGDQIPIEARIVALADIYDALRSPRPYKRGFTHEESYEIITVGDGRVMPQHFDPQVLGVFKDQHNGFNDIYETLKDL